MNRTFLRCHVLAWMAAIVLGYLGAAALNAIPPKLLLSHPLIGPVLPIFATVTLIAIVIAWRMAVLLGSFDLLLIIAGAVVTALAFGAGYTMDVFTFLPDDGHTFFDVLTWGARPFDFRGQLEIFAPILGWAIFTIGTGIAIKRSRESGVPQTARNPSDSRKMTFWLACDLGLIVFATVAILRHEVVSRVALGQPEHLIRTLGSAASPESERMHAIWELASVETDEATRALKDAAQHAEPPVNVAAAGALLARHDMSGLPLIEEYSLHPPAPSAPNMGPINLGGYLEYIKDPVDVPTLVRLMTAPDASVREGAACALRGILTLEQRHGEFYAPDWWATVDLRPVTEAMIAGLDDPDERVRYFSICTLMEININPHYPFVPLFKSHEAEYVNGWKEWAKSRTVTH